MAVPGVPLVQEGDDLAGILLDCMGRGGMSLQDGDVLVLCQKIVSKAEGRVVRLDKVQPGAEALALAAEVDKDPRLVELIM